MNEVRRDEFLGRDAKNVFHVGLRRILHEFIDFLDRAVAARAEREIHARNVRRRNAEGHSGELTFNGRDTFTDGLGGTRRRRNDIHGRRATAAPVLLRGTIDGFLSRGVRVNRGHQACFDSDSFFHQDMNHRSQAVRRA